MRLLGYVMAVTLGVGVAFMANCSSTPPAQTDQDSGTVDPCANGGCAVDAGPADAGSIDAGNPTDAGNPDAGDTCQPSSPARACGKAAACFQNCTAGGVWGECQRGTGTLNLQTDPANCGECGNACPVPLHAAAVCKKGVCGRGACEAGWFDFDREVTFGCEVSCTDKTCTLPNNTTVTLTAPPLPESGLVFQALASGSSFGANQGPQTNSSHTNYGILGESTPPAANGSIEMTGGNHKNIGGFMAIDRKK